MATRPIILLPPSEGKSPGGSRRSPKDRFAGELGAQRRAVRDALRDEFERSSNAELSKLMRVRGPLFVRALESTRLFVDADADSDVPLMPAWRRYSGVVWEHLDPSSLSAPLRSRILIPSALYGLNHAEDTISDYRLTMHASLRRVGNLAKYWKPAITEIVRNFRGHPPIVNLLPAEHRHAFDLTQLGTVVDVRFVAADGQGAAGHQAKAAKGRFARHLIDNGLSEAAGFHFEGWKVSKTSQGFELRAPI